MAKETAVITKAELERRYTEDGTRRLAKDLGVSVPTLYKALKDNGIEMKSKKKPYRKITVIDGE